MIGDAAAHPGAVLLVEDDPTLRSTCERYLARFGHRVDAARSVEEARRYLSSAPPYDVVVTDLQMPGSSGLDLLAMIHSHWPWMRSVLISGDVQVVDAAKAMDLGVDRLLLKPFELDELRAAVEKSLAERRAQVRAAREREMFAALARQRETESKLWILRAAHALAAAVEAKDAYTAGHVRRVTAFAVSLVETMGEIDVSSFRLAVQLHDVGKIGVPDAVLNKPDRLGDAEVALVRRHPVIGARILEPIIDDPLVVGVVRWHHERWDGEGYPDALRGERIPLAARVLAVADTLDAMTSDRAYREALPWDLAVSEIRRGAGTQFDPTVVEAFEGTLQRLASLHAGFHGKRSGPDRVPGEEQDHAS